MNFKPGDKVWIDNAAGGHYPGGTYAAVLISAKPHRPTANPTTGWWTADIDGIPPYKGLYPLAHESNMRRRDDPPQQEPKREATGEWDLCPWRPASVREEVA